MKRTKKPTQQEMLNAALTVLKLGGVQGADLANLIADGGPAAKPRATWIQPAAGHVFSPKWKKETHTCPKCGHTGPVNPDFGMRLVRGIERKQSWCAECRSTTNYYAMPRLADRKAAAAEAAARPFLKRERPKALESGAPRGKRRAQRIP